MAHPLWNDFRRSLRHVSMLGVLLKATAAINHGAGPYRSGTRRITLRQAAKELMEKADEPYMEALTERVLFDRGWAVGNDILSKQEFLASDAVTRRLPYAKNKAWFGVIDCMSKLDKDWTILEETIAMANGTHEFADEDNAAAAANADDDADAQDAEGEADAGAGDAGPPDHENVNSKADLNLLRAQYAHTDAMIEDFMHDHELHLKVRILVFTGRELQLEYAQGLERHKPGQTSMLEWQAARSCGEWFNTICRLYDLLGREDVLKALDLRPSGDEPLAEDQPGLQQDIKIADCMMKLVTELSTARSWSQLHHSLCLPNCFVRVFATGDNLTRSVVTLRRIVAALRSVDRARKQLQPGRGSMLPAVKELAEDIGTMDWLLTREMIAELEICNYDLSDQRLRELGSRFAAFASAGETKNTCENSFNWLADSNKRQSSANKMAQETKYMYLMVCPYATEGGTSTLQIPMQDIRAQGSTDIKQYNGLQPFQGQWRELPFQDVTKAMIKKWRPAGFHAQRRAAAAVAFVMQHSTATGDLDLDALKRCCLLLKGHVYQRSDTGKYVLCFGFLKYACLGIHLKPVHCMGEAGCCQYLEASCFAISVYPVASKCNTTCPQVYLEADLSAAIYPTLIFNGNAGSDSTWRHIPTRTVPPACCPKNSIMLKRTGLLSESPLRSALLSGVFLTREQVVKCMAAEGIPFPETGTGARGRVNKSDLVQKLLSEVLGDTVSEEQRKRLARGLAREAAPEDLPTDMDDGSCPEEILNLLATMDPDNKDSFQKILEQATAILAERQRKKATSHAANPRAKPKDDADKPDDANPASSAAKPDDDATDKPDDAAPPAPPSDADAAGVVAPGGEPELLPARNTVADQVRACSVVFDFVFNTYHMHFSRPTEDQLRDAINNIGARFY
ncbi:unnamed protein product [Symbiodinium sp. KB8]|nr:unnamed protein product [Symbiodinium sp. KB8]